MTWNTWLISVALNVFAEQHRRLSLVWTLDYFLPLFPLLVLVSLKIVSDVTALRGLHFYNIYLPEHSAPDPERHGFSISNSTKLQWLVQMLHCTNKRFPRRVFGGSKPRQTLSVKEATRPGNILATSTRTSLPQTQNAGKWTSLALEKEMATHSSVLAWRIPGTGEPGGLPSVESHRVGHD